MTSSRTAVTFAAAAALIALSGAAMPSAAIAKHAASVPCYGVNTCKGTSDCKTAKNDCKGQNSCKGMGFKLESAKACAAAGGSLTAPM